MRADNKYDYKWLLRYLQTHTSEMQNNKVFALFSGISQDTRETKFRTSRGELADFIMGPLGYGVEIFHMVNSIPEAMFYASENLPDSFVIPENIQAISPLAFCKIAAKSVVVNAGLASNYASISQSCFKQSAITDIKINSQVVTIMQQAFFKCPNLASVLLPDTVKAIDSQAFAECKNLKSIVLPDGISKIASDAFINCDDIEISMPGKLNDPEKLANIIGGFRLVKNDAGQNVPDMSDTITEFYMTHIVWR